MDDTSAFPLVLRTSATDSLCRFWGYSDIWVVVLHPCVSERFLACASLDRLQPRFFWRRADSVQHALLLLEIELCQVDLSDLQTRMIALNQQKVFYHVHDVPLCAL